MRKHYLLGTLAAATSAVHFMVVSQARVFDWAIWFVILVSAAMLIEGLLDLRVAAQRDDDLFKESHAITR